MSYAVHLSKDKKLKKLIELHDIQILKKKKNVCLSLCASIMSQQLSTKVAAVIYKRFINLFNGKEPTAEQILGLRQDELRAIGLSHAKVNYLRNVAAFSLDPGLDFKKLSKMENEEVINYLTGIKGVGRWTAEMQLMFTLGKEDVFAVDDLGIQIAMEKLYKLDRSDKRKLKEEMTKISEAWSPYRTYACLHLWLWKDEPGEKIKKVQTKQS